jgi:hypothetical protein
MVALWLQKIVKSKRTDGINVKPQQHIAIKENQFRKILMPFMSLSDPQKLRIIVKSMVLGFFMLAEPFCKQKIVSKIYQ